MLRVRVNVYFYKQSINQTVIHTLSRKMVGQLLSTAARINYSVDVAKAINFIGRRPGYGSSVPVTVALLQRPILCPVFLDHVPARLTPY